MNDTNQSSENDCCKTFTLKLSVMIALKAIAPIIAIGPYCLIKEESPMKKYIIFSITFVLSFVVLQLIYGYIWSLFYTPNLTDAWSQVEILPSKVDIKGSSSIIPLFFVFLAATIAYFTPKLFMKKSNN